MTLPLKAQKTILIVEDTAAILKIVRPILEQEANFTVLAAASGEEAMQLAEQTKAIDLLLSDVMMPGISGPALELKLKESPPKMANKADVWLSDGAMLVLNYGWHFIRKRFVSVELPAKINDVFYAEMRDEKLTRERGADHLRERLLADLRNHHHSSAYTAFVHMVG